MRRTTLLTTCLLGALLTAGAAFAQGPAPVKKDSKGPGPKSQAEAQAVNAVIQAQAGSPDDMIKAADELVSKYADTSYKSFALELEAEAYQKKNDNTKAIIYGEQALQADPKNYDASNLLANITAATTRDTDLDKEEKLTRAEKYAHESLDTLQSGGRPPLYANLTEEQWAKTKAAGVSLAWQALGTVALVRKKTDDAIADFQKGIEANPDPVLMIRAGRALLAAKKPDDAIVYFEKVMNSADAPAQIKSIAQADRVRAIQAKGGPAPAAAPK
jgi:tetratricopeptide (TPR) repeat protein